jgi:hypothetical protein
MGISATSQARDQHTQALATAQDLVISRARTSHHQKANNQHPPPTA